jgi:hypothetical protein
VTRDRRVTLSDLLDLVGHLRNVLTSSSGGEGEDEPWEETLDLVAADVAGLPQAVTCHGTTPLLHDDDAVEREAQR